MPTRKDNTNVVPIYREQVFIPASGTTLIKQNARPKINGIPVSSGAIDIVSPEFDLLTGVRGIMNLPKGFLKTNKLPQGENLYYRQLDKSSRGLERAKKVGVIDTKSSGGVDIVHNGRTLRLGKTFDTPFFSKGSLWYNNVDDMDVIVGKDNPLLDWKMITQHGRVTNDAVKASSRRTPFYNGATNQAPTELFELYRRYPAIGYRNVTYGFPTIPVTGLNAAAEQMKCGGRRKAQLGLDIREGGIAIPIAPNMYYMNGRSHDDGGIAIGPNNKNGLEVEGGEVVKVGNKDIKVFSSVPLLRGASPAELVMGGANPNTVFKAQEDFKDRNRINDDGTTYEMGGDKVIHINNLPSSFKGQLRNGRYVQIGIPPVTSKAKSWNTTFKDHVNSLNVEMKDFIMDGINYGKKLLPKPLKKYYSRAINILNSPGVQDVNNTAQKITQVTSMFDEKKTGGIYIKPSKRGTFTAAATKHGMGVQEFASKVLANKEDYSPAMVKKANFARNASRWKKEYGGDDTKAAALKRIRNKFTVSGDYDGGMFGGAGAGSVIMVQPEYVTDTITKRYLVPVTQNFNDAFGNAVDAGLDKFMFDNKWYNTEKGNNPNNNAAGAARTQTVIIPVEHKEIRRRKKEYGGSMLYTINGNVKNGLSLRPKALLGKQKTIVRAGKEWKYDEKSGAYVPVKDVTKYKTAAGKTYKKEPDSKNYVEVTDSIEKIKVNQPKKQIVKQNKNSINKLTPINENKYTSITKPNTGESYFINPLTGEWIRNGVTETSEPSVKGTTKVTSKPSSTPRGSENQSSKTTTSVKPATVEQPAIIRRDEYYSSPKVEEPATPVDETYAARQARGSEAVKEALTYPKGAKTNEIDEPLIGKFKPFTLTDAISGLSNMIGSTASYFINRNLIDKYPMPTKPIMTPVVKLKTRFDVSGDIADIEESRRIAADAYKRNTSSSAAYLSRLQSGLNTAYRQKAEARRYGERMTNQLINADLQNRQNVYARNVAIQNDYYNRLVGTRQAKSQLEMQNLNNLISGLTGGVTSIMSNIDTRANYNKMAQAIQAANPNVDPRLLGIYDYYEGKNTGKKYNKRGQVIN